MNALAVKCKQQEQSLSLFSDNLRGELAQMTTIQEVKEWQDKAKALKAYASKRRDRQGQANELTKAIVWSMREMGRIIQEMQARGELAEQGGYFGKSKYNDGILISLSDIGITANESSWCKCFTPRPKKLLRTTSTSASRATSRLPSGADVAKQWSKEQTIEDAAEQAAAIMAEDAEFIAPTIYLADALDFIAGFEDDTFDLLLTDPPYSTDVEDIEAFAAERLPLALAKVKPTGRAYICIGAYPVNFSPICQSCSGNRNSLLMPR